MSPLPGVQGHLVADALLTSRAAQYGEVEGHAIDRLQHDLATWHRDSRRLGPASSLRVMVDACASPFFAVLGFSPLERIMIERNAAVATWRHATTGSGLLSQRGVRVSNLYGALRSWRPGDGEPAGHSCSTASI